MFIILKSAADARVDLRRRLDQAACLTGQGTAATPTALAGGRDKDQRSTTSKCRLCRGFAQ